jgi:glycerol-3-phosphate dehydrogenase subunit B
MDLLVVGAGLCGLFAAYTASKRGARVALIAKGRGGLATSPGCIGVWRRSTPSRALPKLRQTHPYQLCGRESIQAAIELFIEMTADRGYAFAGDLSSNIRLPTAFGSELVVALAPVAFIKGDFEEEAPITLGKISRLRDFQPALMASNLRRRGIKVSGIVELPFPTEILSRDLYPTDLAHVLDTKHGVDQLARLWRPLMTDVDRLGLPAILGLKQPSLAYQDLEDQLEVDLFEIPTLPPSVPGLRLERMFRQALRENAVEIIEGAQAIGRVDGRSKGKRVAGVVLQASGSPRVVSAGAVLLATGGFLHGGMVARQNGVIQESVFDLPVTHIGNRTAWIHESIFDNQPYNNYGILVDDKMRPLNAHGERMFSNLFAAGGILAGADRASEGSRQGIDLASAHRAVEVALS